MTQPALTRAIQKLEAELGGHLFHREHSHVHLTDFARLMQPHRPNAQRLSVGSPGSGRYRSEDHQGGRTHLRSASATNA
ncbi:MAG: LysR family transcriptional regulator [Mesorhizobium sp.]|nr:MAG: LysR family transcriptional regulator [Mesorhizobium sp.]RWM75460.1 MAG: LysR family transcriptional regulator [Mesorhizobium sp.]TIO23287.1 MAG: LysR family transcriptional regulator [Mesorhizobium sp.]TJV61406.1 MAG: LysR family transcriptional regulator [Mesorhizobium sp.]